MADQIAYSINELRNVRGVDLGNGSSALAVSLASGSDSVLGGTVSVTTTRQQLSSVNGSSIKIKAPQTNTSTVYVGGNNVSSTNGFPLAPGEDTGWMPVTNLSAVWYISAYADQLLSYFVAV